MFDPIKYVPLIDDRVIWASFSGHVSNRYEVWKYFGLGGGGPREHSFLLSRITLHPNVHAGGHLRFYAEGNSVLST